MRIAIMGSGALGAYYGAQLVTRGHDVSFIARGAHLAALRSRGLRILSPFGDVTLPQVVATDRPGEIGVVDVILFAVKLYDTEPAASALPTLVGPHTRVITLQNGIDGPDIIARHVGASCVVPGATYLSGFIAEPGVIQNAGGLDRLVIARRDDEQTRAFVDALDGAPGVSIDHVDDAEPEIWEKFLVISSFSGATSLMRSGIGPILANPLARTFLEQLRDEGMQVATAAGRRIHDGFAERAMERWRRLPGTVRSSMATDLERGRPLELRWLSGRIHELGAELGVATPAHSAVYQALDLYADGST